MSWTGAPGSRVPGYAGSIRIPADVCDEDVLVRADAEGMIGDDHLRGVGERVSLVVTGSLASSGRRPIATPLRAPRPPAAQRRGTDTHFSPGPPMS